MNIVSSVLLRVLQRGQIFPGLLLFNERSTTSLGGEGEMTCWDVGDILKFVQITNRSMKKNVIKNNKKMHFNKKNAASFKILNMALKRISTYIYM